MTVTLSIYGNGMRGITIDGNGEAPEYLDEVKQKLGVIIFSEERVDVDVIDGATLTSRAVLQAAAEVFEQIRNWWRGKRYTKQGGIANSA